MNSLLTRDLLSKGEVVKVRPKGNSMKPYIYSGEQVIIHPVTDNTPLPDGTIVFCKVRGRYFLHFIHSSKGEKQFCIGNARGHINGWTTRDNIYGWVPGKKVK